MFGFGRKKRTLPGTHCFAVKTRIGRSTGGDGKFSCGSVRALPSVNKDEVVLQATDGHQAACLLTHGQMTSPRLVPTGVLPTRQLPKPVGMRVSFTWFGVRKTLTPQQKEQAAESFGAEGNFRSAGKKLLNTKHPAFKAVTSIRNRIVSYWRGIMICSICDPSDFRFSIHLEGNQPCSI